jgi:ParB-like chromosome segregation protein Spo0J
MPAKQTTPGPPPAAPAESIKPYDIKAFREIPAERLVRADWNYKEDDELRASKLAENLKRNGQIINVVVRLLPTGYYEVLDGNHRLDAINKLGWKTIVCYDLGTISDARAKRIAIEVNETRFVTNIGKLAGLIGEIEEEFPRDDLALTLPYSESEIEALEEMGKPFTWNDDEPSPDKKLEGLTDRVKMEFMLTNEQFKVINEALMRIITELQIEGEYRTARALELIAADSMNTPIESYQ